MEELLCIMSPPTKARDIALFCSGIQIVRLILSLAIHRDISDKDDKSDKKLLLLKVRKNSGETQLSPLDNNLRRDLNHLVIHVPLRDIGYVITFIIFITFGAFIHNNQYP